MNTIKRLWCQEPAGFVAAIQTFIALFVAFGVQITANQVGAIMAALTAFGGLLVRSQVTSTRALQAYANDVAAQETGLPPETP